MSQRKFSEVLQEYLDFLETDEFDHPDYVDGYTNKQYYKDKEKLEDEIDSFFK